MTSASQSSHATNEPNLQSSVVPKVTEEQDTEHDRLAKLESIANLLGLSAFGLIADKAVEYRHKIAVLEQFIADIKPACNLLKTNVSASSRRAAFEAWYARTCKQVVIWERNPTRGAYTHPVTINDMWQAWSAAFDAGWGSGLGAIADGRAGDDQNRNGFTL